MRKAASEFVMTFQRFREQDQEVIIRYLEQTLTVIQDFKDRYMKELDAQAKQREKEAVFLDLATQVLQKYV